MTGSPVALGWGLGIALAALLALAVTAALAARIGTAGPTVTAAIRATVQLAAVSGVIVAVVGSLWATVTFVAAMVVIASLTAGRRITPGASGRWAAVALVAGTAPVLAIVLMSGAVPFTGIAVVPISGIVIGGAMTATSLAGRRALDDLAARHGEYEAALSLGFLDRDAAMEIVRPSAADALLPALDQTRTVGLVTLPGAFVGVLIGSGNPVQAGAAQLLVLIGLLAAETIAVFVAVELVARGHVHRNRGGLPIGERAAANPKRRTPTPGRPSAPP